MKLTHGLLIISYNNAIPIDCKWIAYRNTLDKLYSLPKLKIFVDSVAQLKYSLKTLFVFPIYFF